MAVDRLYLEDALGRFYDFSGKVVLYVGGAHAQLLDASIKTNKRIYIDTDKPALGNLRSVLADNGSIDIIASIFEKVA